MHVAERLYLSGYLTYPRTETTKYPGAFNFKSVVNSVSKSMSYGRFAKKLLKDGFTKPKGGKDAGDHPPITPTINYPSGLSGQ